VEKAITPGGVYGVPAFTFIDWMYYRKDWFDQAGIAGPPRTLDEFASVARKITDPAKGRYGFGLGGGAGGTSYLFYVFGSYGCFKVADGKPALDRKGAIEARVSTPTSTPRRRWCRKARSVTATGRSWRPSEPGRPG
jgi:ABC-type glycerol-3-phosphate transport system substrate-binding protein